MSNHENKGDANVLGGGGYKPLIATSLFFALGISEIKAEEGVWLKESGEIESKTIDKAVEFEVSSPKDSLAGILIKPDTPSMEITATLKGDVIITSSALQDTTKNRYGIYVDNGANKTTFGSNDSSFRTITIEAISLSEDNKEAYVFKNAQNEEVAFEKVRLILGEKHEDLNEFGICNTSDANYDFGGTSLKAGTLFGINGAKGNEGDANNDGLMGMSVSGIVLSAQLNHTGNLSQSIVGGVGGDAKAGSRAGGTGGSAYGLDFVGENGAYILSTSKDILNLTVVGGKGGNGSSNGEEGDKGDKGGGGDAVGIFSDSINAKLTLGIGSRAVISAKGGEIASVGKENTGVGGEAIGVWVYTDTQNGSGVERSKLTILGNGTLALSVGDATTTSAAYGLKLEDGIFVGNLKFGKNTISAISEVYGIHTSGESMIEGGAIIFGVADTMATAKTKYILFNEGGTLTLAGGARIVNGAGLEDDAGITDTFGGVYKFGGGDNTVGTQINDADTSTMRSTTITGVYFKPEIDNASITLGGKLGVKGSKAVGLIIDMSEINADSKSSLVIDSAGFVLNVVGGDTGQVKVGSSMHDRLATGLYFNTAEEGNITVTGGDISLILSDGKAGRSISTTAYTHAFSHSGEGSVTFDGVTLYNLPFIAQSLPLDTRYGIYNLVAAAYDFGSDGGKTVFKSFKATEGKKAVGIFSSAMQIWNGGEVVFEGIVGGVGQSNDSGDGEKGGDAIGVMFDGKKYRIEYGAKISMTIIGGQGGDGNLTSGKKGDGGDAYGFIIHPDQSVLEFGNGAELLLTIKGGAPGENGKENGVAGDATGIFIKGNDKDFRQNNDFRIDSISADLTLKLQVGDKENLSKNKDAYGLKLGNSSYEGGGVIIAFDGKDSWIAANDSNGKAYALYSSGRSFFQGGSIIIESDGLKGREKYALYNAGESLTLGRGARIIAGNDAKASEVHLYAADNATLDAVFADGSTTTFSIKAFDSSGSGTINLTLKNSAEKGGAKLAFNDDAGKLGVLKGDCASILLAGENQESVKTRIAQGNFTARTLVIADMQLKDSVFVLAAKTNGEKLADSIRIDGSKATEMQNNNIAIVLDGYSKNSTSVTLASVSEDAKDKAIFNGLSENDTSAKSVAYSGFTTAEVVITREEDENGGVKYVSTLETTNPSINSELITPTTAALSANLTVFSVNLNSLSKRMGELRSTPYSHGIWARVFAGEQISDFGAKQTMLYTTFQAGYDYKFDLKNAQDYFGVAISYIKGSGGKVTSTHQYTPFLSAQIISELTSCNTSGVEIALYNSYIANSGFYSDSVVKLGYFGNTLSLYAQPQTYSTENIAFALSEEVGYKFVLGKKNEWFITPQAELALGYVGESSFTQKMYGEEMYSRQEGVMIFRSRVGSAWGYDFSHLTNKFKISAYLGTYFVYDCFVGGDTFLKALDHTGEYLTLKNNAYEESGRFVMNLGANIGIKERTSMYFDFEKSFGGNVQINYQISLGVRFEFGKRVSAPKQEEKKASETLLKPKELGKNTERIGL